MDVGKIPGAIVLKEGVSLANLSPQITIALITASAVYASFDYGLECVVTSANDSHHSVTSLHYAGNAVDLRTRDFPSREIAIAVAEKLDECLGYDFDVLFEEDHIHIEYQPKRR
jgi:hypothetical protein